MTTKPARKWTYERGEGRTKHCWNKPFAGFAPSRRGQVGKCSNQITDVIATALLNEGIPEECARPGRGGNDSYPQRIYTVHDGAIYVAVPTQPGKSYHGYPVRGILPRRLVKELRQKAEAAGCLPKFEKWVREYIK